MLAGYHAYPRSDGCAIALGSQQFDLDPVLLVAAIISKQRRRVVHIENQNVDVAIVVVVSKRGAAAGILFAYPGTHLRRHVFEAPVAEVPVNQARVLEGLAEVVLVYLRINMAVDLNNVCPAIVVIIDKAAAPRHVAVVNSHPGSKGYVAERAVAIVVIQVAGVIGKVGLENVKPSVAIVVRNRDPHTRLLVPVVAVGATCY